MAGMNKSQAEAFLDAPGDDHEGPMTTEQASAFLDAPDAGPESGLKKAEEDVVADVKEAGGNVMDAIKGSGQVLAENPINPGAALIGRGLLAGAEGAKQLLVPVAGAAVGAYKKLTGQGDFVPETIAANERIAQKLPDLTGGDPLAQKILASGGSVGMLPLQAAGDVTYELTGSPLAGAAAQFVAGALPVAHGVAARIASIPHEAIKAGQLITAAAKTAGVNDELAAVLGHHAEARANKVFTPGKYADHAEAAVDAIKYDDLKKLSTRAAYLDATGHSEAEVRGALKGALKNKVKQWEYEVTDAVPDQGKAAGDDELRGEDKEPAVDPDRARVADLDARINAEQNKHVKAVLTKDRNELQAGIEKREGAAKLQSMAVEALRNGDRATHDRYMAEAEKLDPSEAAPVNGIKVGEQPAEPTAMDKDRAAVAAAKEKGKTERKEPAAAGVEQAPEEITLETAPDDTSGIEVQEPTPEPHTLAEPSGPPPAAESIPGVDATTDVPLLGGKAKDGTTLIDRDLPRHVWVPEAGKWVDTHAEIHAHETGELGADKPGAGDRVDRSGYSDAHDRFGNSATRAYLEGIGVKPEDYARALQPFIDEAKAKADRGEAFNIHKGLDERPYKASGLDLKKYRRSAASTFSKIGKTGAESIRQKAAENVQHNDPTQQVAGREVPSERPVRAEEESKGPVQGTGQAEGQVSVRVPEEAAGSVAAAGTEEGVSHATDEGQQPGNGEQQRAGTGQERTAAEAGSSDRTQPVSADGGQGEGKGPVSPQHEIDFQLSEAPRKGMLRKRVEDLARLITQHWKNAPKIVVHDHFDADTVPANAKARYAALREGGTKGTPTAWYSDGTVHIVASAMGDTRHVIKSVFHEAIAHHGLMGAFGDALDSMLADVVKNNAADVAAKIKEYGMKPHEKLKAAEEVLARMAETNPKLTVVRNAFAAIRGWLRKNVPGFRGMKFSDDDLVHSFLAPARKWVEGGALERGGADGEPAFALGDKPKTVAEMARKLYGMDESELTDGQKRDLANMARDMGLVGKDEKLLGKDDDVPMFSLSDRQHTTSIKNVVTDVERKQRGSGEIESEAARGFGEAWSKSEPKTEGDRIRHDALIDELKESPRAINDIEDAILLRRKIAAHNERRAVESELNDAVDRGDDLAVAQKRVEWARLEDINNDLDLIAKRVGTATARGLNARKMMANQDYSLVAIERRMRAAKGGKPLTPEEGVKAKDFAKKIEGAEQAVTDKEDALTPKDEKGDAQQKEIDSLTHDVNKNPTDVGGLSVLIDRLAKQGRTKFDDVATDIHDEAPNVEPGQIEKAWDRVRRVRPEHGLDETKSAKRSILESYKNRLRKRIDELKQQITDGEKNPPKNRTKLELDKEAEDLKKRRDDLSKEFDTVFGRQLSDEQRLALMKKSAMKKAQDYRTRREQRDFATRQRRQVRPDAELLKLRAAAESEKIEFTRALIAQQLKDRQLAAKAADAAASWHRTFLLSSPVTLGKLGAAAATRAVTSRVEDVVGRALTKVVPKLGEAAAKAPREGTGAVSKAAQDIADGLTARFSYTQEAGKTLKKGYGDLEALYGKADIMPFDEFAGIFGRSHAAIKSPVKLDEFKRSLAKRIEFGIRNGEDVHDPAIQMMYGAEAYKDARRSVFMQDNAIVDFYKRGMTRLKQKPGEDLSVSKKGAETTANILLPIIKVPTNLALETARYALGSAEGAGRLARAVAKGMENLKPEEAETIMRAFKKGSVGAIGLLLGYFNPQAVGGYWSPGDKRKDSEPGFGQFMISGEKVPTWLLHNPLLETVQIGATIRRTMDKVVKGQHPGLAAGIVNAALGLSESIPFVKEMFDTGSLRSPSERGRALNEFARNMVVPLGVQWAAKHFDQDSQGNTIARDPKTMWESIETGIPGLRSDVQVKRK